VFCGPYLNTRTPYGDVNPARQEYCNTEMYFPMKRAFAGGALIIATITAIVYVNTIIGPFPTLSRACHYCNLSESVPNKSGFYLQGLKPNLHEATPVCGVSCPNIVYMLADDLGYGDVRYNGGNVYTPNLDAMANGQHSIQFKRFYSGGPTCSPTRGTLLTGRNHNRYCVWHADVVKTNQDLSCPSLMPLPSSELTVAEVLTSAGYETSIYGKWHLGDLRKIEGGNSKWPVSNPSTHGFQHWLVTERRSSTLLPNCKCFSNFTCSLEEHQYDIQYCRNYWYINPSSNKLTKSTNQVFDDADFLVDCFEKFLKTRNRSQPFYSQISFHSVHAPYHATPFWRNHYSYVSDTDKMNYLGATSALDHAVGRVRTLLKKFEVYNNTILWFSSDNGPQTGQPGSTGGLRGRKGSVWEGGIRVPGIIEWPEVISENRKSSVPVVTSDFLPTIADIVDFKVSTDIILDGVSLLPILKTTSAHRDSNIKFAFHIKRGDLKSNFAAAVVGERYKYYAAFDDGKIQSSYLFDLESDSSEKTDISSRNPNVTLSMKAELQDFLLSVTKSAKQVGCVHTHDRTTVNC
jgi:arylsulfatase A-like enzyme